MGNFIGVFHTFVKNDQIDCVLKLEVFKFVELKRLCFFCLLLSILELNKSTNIQNQKTIFKLNTKTGFIFMSHFNTF
jgi:hypothetical protein